MLDLKSSLLTVTDTYEKGEPKEKKPKRLAGPIWPSKAHVGLRDTLWPLFHI
jgi:hypothetical protein